MMSQETPKKRPTKTNLGGLWLFNPDAPRCVQTCLEGVKQTADISSNIGNRLEFEPYGTSHTGSASAVPTAWVIDVPDDLEIVSGAEPKVYAGGTAYAGSHILMQQSVTERDTTRGGAGQPFLFSKDFKRTISSIPHCVWWDSTKYIQRETTSPGVILTDLSIFRGHLWSLYYGNDPQYLGIDTVDARRWWLVCQLEPVPEVAGADEKEPFKFNAAFVFSHPLADNGAQSNSASAAGSEDQQARFDGLGANVFKRLGQAGEQTSDTIIARPFYR